MSEILLYGPKFENLTLKSLPVDNGPNYVRKVPDAIFVRVRPTPVLDPEIVVYSKEALSLLDIEINEKDEKDMEILVQHLSGNKVWDLSDPAAHCYCGHQFGNFAGQLGDGAAIYLGDLKNRQGKHFELQLKGAGKTPFSRTADGRKVFRSSVREFLASEALHHLNIPTTRAGSVVTSSTKVHRDPFYDGNVIMEKASITSRIAESFIRFGSFEICNPMSSETMCMGPSNGKFHLIIRLLNYVIREYYPQHWKEEFNGLSINNLEDLKNIPFRDDLIKSYESFFEEITDKTASLVAKWNSVGFCHGVLNTDNMSILGLTIDYGPYGFMEQYISDFICNGSDQYGRYSYNNQTKYCHWNLRKLARAISLGIETISPDRENYKNLLEIVDRFEQKFENHSTLIFSKKLGLCLDNLVAIDDKTKTANSEIIDSLMTTMEQTGSDFTKTFLTIEYLLSKHGENLKEAKVDIFIEICCDVESLKSAIRPKISMAQLLVLEKLKTTNPGLYEEVGGDDLLKEKEKFKKIELLNNLTEETKQQADLDLWTKWMEKYINLIHDRNLKPKDMNDQMCLWNPRFILRNYIMEEALKKGEEQEDYQDIWNIYEKIRQPFTPKEITEELLQRKRPSWAKTLRVT